MNKPQTATALIATADSGEERATISIIYSDDTEFDKIDLGEDGYLTEAVDTLRARGWRVYPEAIIPRRGLSRRARVGYYETTIYAG